MTTNPATTNPAIVPSRVKTAGLLIAAACILVVPGPTKAVGRQFIHNLGEIIGVDDETPIELPLPDGNQ